MGKNNYAAIAVISLLILATILGAFHFMHKPHEEIESEYQVTNPWRETINIDKGYVAQIRAIQHIELRSLEKGYLQNIFVDEGQIVEKGQKMFQIMPMLLEAEFKKADAEFHLAQIEYNNTVTLNKRNVVSTNEVALSKAKLDKAEAQMELAKAHLEFSEVKAPFSGIMDRFQVRLGSLIDEGELLTTLSDNSQMWVYFNVSEADYLDYMKLHKKAENIVAKLRLANGDIFPYDGIVDTIEADFNNEVGNVAFRASFPNPDRLLRHGETGTVLLTKKIDNALIIPQKATFEILDKKFVYLVNDKNEIESREIKIAEEIPHFFVIASGIDEKDKILLEGLGKLRPGDVVKTVYQDVAAIKKSLQLSVGIEGDKKNKLEEEKNAQ